MRAANITGVYLVNQTISNNGEMVRYVTIIGPTLQDWTRMHFMHAVYESAMSLLQQVRAIFQYKVGQCADNLPPNMFYYFVLEASDYVRPLI